MKKLAIGIDIGGTRTKIGLVSVANGKVQKLLIYPTATDNAYDFLFTIEDAVNQFKAIAIKEAATISGIGIGVPSFVFDNGVVDSTYGFLPFMEDYPLQQIIEEKCSLPCRLDNDARVVALGEALYGMGKNSSRVLVLTLGTGLGLGFTINGKLNEPLPYAHMGGHITVATNDVACYCGRKGCLESLVSATGLCNAALRMQWPMHNPAIAVTAEGIFNARSFGNEMAMALVSEFIGYLTIGIENYINLFAPDMIILGGGVAKGLSGDLHLLQQPQLLHPFKAYKTSIVLSALQEEAGVLGSAALFNE